MKAVLQGLIAEAASARIDRHRERTRTAGFARWNATVNRDLPEQPEETDNVTLGVLLHALGQSESSHSAGAGAGELAGSGARGGASGTAAASPIPTSVGESGPAAANRGGAEGAAAGGSDAAAASAGPGLARRVWRKAWPWLAAGAATGIVGGFGGTAVNWWLLRDAQSRSVPAAGDEDAAAHAPRDGSLYQWLEDNGYHLPPEEAAE